ncbi:MAG: PepSY-associated TM helix domain-containing protein [Planctomycetota bacterium]|nr:PepSY-associated TM helix domain-containing protein [Planctomycetota bacterium]
MRALHRDLGYLFAGVTLLYAISGLLVNHKDAWDSDFEIRTRQVAFELPASRDAITDDDVHAAIRSIADAGVYRGHDFASDKRLKVYFDDGSLVTLLGTGLGEYETVRRRELLFRLNKLHLHPRGWWRLFADAFSIGLAFLAISGLLLLKGRKGFFGRGKWFVLAGAAVPGVAIWFAG